MAPGILSTSTEEPLQAPSPFQAKTVCNPHNYTLLNSTLVTADYSSLAFNAAASLQLQLSGSLETGAKRNSLLISSPYNSPSHLLDLSHLDTPNQLFALALSFLRPVRADYATAPYEDSFNWSEVFATLKQLANLDGYTWKEQSFYVVIFRSKLNPNINVLRLTELDSRSHEEATVSGGLLKYWFGSPNGERRNLATCLWRSADDARAGGGGEWHKQARAAARELYEKIVFTVHKLTISEGVSGWRLEDWDRKS